MPPDVDETILESLIPRAIAGDEPSLKRLLKALEPWALISAGNQMRPGLRRTVDPEDIVQQVFLYVATEITSFKPRTGKPEQDFKAWVKDGITKRVRQAGRDSKDGVERLLNALEGATSSKDRPSKPLRREEIRTQVVNALSQLSDIDRRIIQLFCFQSETKKNIARELGLTEAAVIGRIQRALLKLREHMGRSSQYDFQRARRRGTNRGEPAS